MNDNNFLENLNLKVKLDTGTRYTNKSMAASTTNDNSDVTGQGAGSKAWVHDSTILKSQATDPSKANDRKIMAEYQEYASVIVFKVAELLTKNEITIYNRKTSLDGKLEKRKINKSAMYFWRKWNMQSMLRKAIEFIRTQGIVIYTKNKRYNFANRLNEDTWKLLSHHQINIINDRQGIIYDVQGQEVIFNTVLPFQLKLADIVYFDPEQTDNKTGKDSLRNVWNKLLSLECIGSSLEIFLERLGLGFLHVDVPAGMRDTVKANVKSAITNLRSELGIYTESDEKNKATIDFKSPSMNAIFEQVLNSIKADIAVGAQLPLQVFNSDEQNSEVVQSTLLSLANKYEVFVRKVLVFEGIIQDINEVEVDFNIGKPSLEIEINQVEIAKNSMIAGKLWLTINEKREIDDMPPIEGGEEIDFQGKTDKVNTSNETGFESASFEGDEKTKPKQFEKKQLSNETAVEQSKTEKTTLDSDLSLDYAKIEDETIRSLAKKASVSLGTATKLLTYFKTKHKDFVTKIDSYESVGEKIHFNAIMLAPNDKLEYRDLKDEVTRVEIQDKEEIGKWFNDANVSKEFNLGVEFSAIPHNGGAEVSRIESIGVIRANEMDQEGNIHASGIADLEKIDKFLGKDNYVRDAIKNGVDINLSAGMLAREQRLDSMNVKRTNLDVRSVMIVKKGRNAKTIIVKN